MKTRDANAAVYATDVMREALEEAPQSLHRDPNDWQRSPLYFPYHLNETGMINLHDWRAKSHLTRSGRMKPSGPWTQAFELAGIRRRPPRQMRHTFSVLALKTGVPIEDVALMLRHKDGDTEMVRQHYAEIVPAMARRSLEQLN